MDLYLRNKFLVRVIIFLIILNICTVGYLWWQFPSDHQKQTQKKDSKTVATSLQKELQLSDSQEKRLKKIREDFFAKEDVLSKLIKKQRDSMNLIMFNEITDTLLVKKIARRVAENEYNMEMYRIDQAEQLRQLCNDKQLGKLHQLVIDIRDYFRPEKTDNDKSSIIKE